jgi:hypothetical protein
MAGTDPSAPYNPVTACEGGSFGYRARVSDGEPDGVRTALAWIVADSEPLEFLPESPLEPSPVKVLAYRDGDTWLLVTVGLSDVQVEDGPRRRAGIELSLRVPRGVDHFPPLWTARMLHLYGSYVATTARPLHVGHRMDTCGPITGRPGTTLVGTAFLDDEEIPSFDAPAGQVRFLRVPGITEDELRKMQSGAVDAVTARLRTRSARLLTDISAFPADAPR